MARTERRSPPSLAGGHHRRAAVRRRAIKTAASAHQVTRRLDVAQCGVVTRCSGENGGNRDDELTGDHVARSTSLAVSGRSNNTAISSSGHVLAKVSNSSTCASQPALLGLDPHRQVLPADLRLLCPQWARRSFATAVTDKLPMLRAMLMVIGSLHQLF